MNTMARKALLLTATFAAAATLTSRVEAQPYDHLKCFKAKDVKTFKKATADIEVTAGHLAGLAPCTISAGAKEFCIPVSKNNVTVEDGSHTPTAGEDHVYDRLCYKLKCPKTEPGPQGYADQFGSRVADKFKVSTICTPAVKGPPPEEPAPTWPATPQDYTPGEASYLDTLTVPPLSGGNPTCCKDFGAISKNSGLDNALSELADDLSSLGIDLQGTLTDAIESGSLVLLLDHQDLDPLSLPDQFTIAQFIGAFAPGTDYTLASQGLGSFEVNAAASFEGGTGEPVNWYHPATMGSPAMTAGPFSLSLTLPFGFLTLDLSAEQAEVAADHGAITSAGVPYTNGEISGFVLMDNLYGGLNQVLNSPTCDCLNLTQDVYYKDANNAWTSFNRCVSNASTLCPNPEEEVCVTLAGSNVFGSPPEVCGVLPAILNDKADIDLNSNTTVYEGLSLGLQWTAQNATYTVP